MTKLNKTVKREVSLPEFRKYQKEIKKYLPTIFKSIKEANTIQIQIDSGVFEFPNRKTGGIECGPNGESTITFYLYHRKRDQKNKVIKRACGEKD